MRVYLLYNIILYLNITLHNFMQIFCWGTSVTDKSKFAVIKEILFIRHIIGIEKINDAFICVTVRTGNERDLWPVRGVLFKFLASVRIVLVDGTALFMLVFVLFWYKGSCTKVYSSVQGHWESYKFYDGTVGVGLLVVSARIEGLENFWEN